MPVAIVDPEVYQRRDLKSLEGAYIMVRPLPHGMVLRRRDKASKMFIETNMGSQGHRKKQEDVSRLEIETMQEWSTAFDYKYCIGQHNLEDKDGNMLDLGSPLVIQQLDPKVGAELDSIIANLNDYEEDADFISPPSTSSQEQGIESQERQDMAASASPTLTQVT